MEYPRRIVYYSKGNIIFLQSGKHRFSIQLEPPFEQKDYTNDCSFCGQKTQQRHFYAVSYSIIGTTKIDRMTDAIELDDVCESHFDEPDFHTKIIQLVSDRLAEIAKNLACMTPEAFTITPSN